jgi:hypothetical protein
VKNLSILAEKAIARRILRGSGGKDGSGET